MIVVLNSCSRKPFVLGGLVALLAGAAQVGAAVTPVSLFTTSTDFTGWGPATATLPSVDTAAPSLTYDYDGATINGAGNNPGNSGSTVNPGGTSPGGSIQITDPNPSGLGYSVVAFSPGEAYNNAFMQAIDPGAITAFTAATSYGAGSTVAYAGTFQLTYTVPVKTAGNYYQIGINLNYAAGNYYAAFLTTTSNVNDGTVGGFTTYTETIPYTINAGTGNLTNFQLNIQTNSNYVTTTPFYVDAISVIPAAVPEPTSCVGLLAAGAFGLLRRRRQALVR